MEVGLLLVVVFMLVYYKASGVNAVVALVFNGMPGELKHQKRVRAVLNALYEDLGLTGEEVV